MVSLTLRIVSLGAFCLFVSGCWHSTKRYQTNQCYELVRQAMLARMDCPAWSQEYMIIDHEDLPYSCVAEIVAELPAGERVRFTEVIYQWQGSWGSCWRIFGDLASKADIGVVEVPSCSPALHPEGWVVVVDGKVNVNPERLRGCSN